jgi:hypothetical protein
MHFYYNVHTYKHMYITSALKKYSTPCPVHTLFYIICTYFNSSHSLGVAEKLINIVNFLLNINLKMTHVNVDISVHMWKLWPLTVSGWSKVANVILVVGRGVKNVNQVNGSQVNALSYVLYCLLKIYHPVIDNSRIKNTYLPEDRCSLYLTKIYKNCKYHRIAWPSGISSLIDFGGTEKFRYVARIYG